MGKESARNAGGTGDTDSTPGLGRSPGGGSGQLYWNHHAIFKTKSN